MNEALINDYKAFLAQLQGELTNIENISVDAEVEQKVNEYRAQIESELKDKKAKMLADKHLEIKLTQGLIDRLVAENEKIQEVDEINETEGQM